MATGCTEDGVIRTLLLVPISIDMKLTSFYLKSGKSVQYTCNFN
jgi:hypothetical protein